MAACRQPAPASQLQPASSSQSATASQFQPASYSHPAPGGQVLKEIIYFLNDFLYFRQVLPLTKQMCFYSIFAMGGSRQGLRTQSLGFVSVQGGESWQGLRIQNLGFVSAQGGSPSRGGRGRHEQGRRPEGTVQPQSSAEVTNPSSGEWF